MIVAEHIIALCPTLHSIIVDSVPFAGIFGERVEEVCVEEIDPIHGDLEFGIQVSGILSINLRLLLVRTHTANRN